MKEVRDAIKRINNGISQGMDGVKVMKAGKEVVTELMTRLARA